MVVGMHLCRGNFAGAWVAEGGYDPIAELLFNEIAVYGDFFEDDLPRAGDFTPLRFLPKRKIAVLVCYYQERQAESKDEIEMLHRRGQPLCAARTAGAVTAVRRALQRYRRQCNDGRGRNCEAGSVVETAQDVWGLARKRASGQTHRGRSGTEAIDLDGLIEFGRYGPRRSR